MSMLIDIDIIFNGNSKKDEIRTKSQFSGLDSYNYRDCDLIALTHTGLDIRHSYKAFYTDESKSKIVIDDGRNLGLILKNKIFVRDKDIHEINGKRFVMVKVNDDLDNLLIFGKYYPITDWL